MDIKKIGKWILVVLGLIVLIFIYKSVNPVESNFFPKCPFHQLTGYKCPGCGSQRSIHYLLNFEISNAFHENAMLVISIPYILLGICFDLIKIKNKKQLAWRKRLFGTKAILIILILIILFWILRNG